MSVRLTEQKYWKTETVQDPLFMLISAELNTCTTATELPFICPGGLQTALLTACMKAINNIKHIETDTDENECSETKVKARQRVGHVLIFY